MIDQPAEVAHVNIQEFNSQFQQNGLLKVEEKMGM